MLKNIKLLRKELGISQQKLAVEIGMSQQSINAYENSDVEPDISTLIKIADFFETSVDFILGYTTIRRKIEEAKPYALNQQEAVHIDRFRKLSPQIRITIDTLIDEILKH